MNYIYSNDFSAQKLSEQLRLIMEPKKASALKGACSWYTTMKIHPGIVSNIECSRLSQQEQQIFFLKLPKKIY